MIHQKALGYVKASDTPVAMWEENLLIIIIIITAAAAAVVIIIIIICSLLCNAFQ
jgi:hypothetical protein